MDRRQPPRPYGAAVATNKARRHFLSIAMLSQLDRAERHVTTEQFAAAAKIAARAVSIARRRTHRSPSGAGWHPNDLSAHSNAERKVRRWVCG